MGMMENNDAVHSVLRPLSFNNVMSPKEYLSTPPYMPL